jgi:hypothetical protein
MTTCWILYFLPFLLGLYGLALVLNAFGAADDLVNLYRGRPLWYPVLDGESRTVHRSMGAILLVNAIVLFVFFSRVC